jgi:hypothetical protein
MGEIQNIDGCVVFVMRIHLFSVLSTILLLYLLPPVVTADKTQLNALIAKIENDTIEFARKVEELYQYRCTTALLNCSRNNYDGCVAKFPDATCYKSDQLFVSACSASRSDTCAALFDFKVSAVRLPSAIAVGNDYNPTDPQVSQ